MPLYEYECTKCHRLTEKIESVNGPHLKKCPHCGGKVERQLSAAAIQFKGSGWYVTDYAGKKPDAEPSSAEKSATKDSAASKDTDASTKDSSAKESTPKDSKDTADHQDKKSTAKKKS